MANHYLNLGTDVRREALEFAASESGRPAYLLEKDIWVVWTLQTLFAAPVGASLVFKGGTSLSKAYGVIRRFSEDVDLTYDIRDIAPDLIGDSADPLPLRTAESLELERQQVQALADLDVPLLLFLDRIADFRIDIRSPDGSVQQRRLSRRQNRLGSVPGIAGCLCTRFGLARTDVSSWCNAKSIRRGCSTRSNEVSPERRRSNAGSSGRASRRFRSRLPGVAVTRRVSPTPSPSSSFESKLTVRNGCNEIACRCEDSLGRLC